MTDPKTPADVLDAAADLISGPGRWVQRDYARNAEGGKVLPNSKAAVCFCATGAIAHVQRQGAMKATWGAPVDLVERHIGHYSLADWNDDPGRTQAEVVEALRSAARKAREASHD